MFYEMVEEFVDGNQTYQRKTDWNNKRIYRQTRSSKHSNEDPNSDKILEILDHEINYQTDQKTYRNMLTTSRYMNS